MLLDRDNLIVCLQIALPFSNRRALKRREVVVKPNEREERILCYHCLEQRVGSQKARRTGQKEQTPVFTKTGGRCQMVAQSISSLPLTEGKKCSSIGMHYEFW